MTDIIIPPEALEAAAISLMGKLMVSNEDAQHLWDKLYEPEKNRFRREAHTAIHAALAAWPGAWGQEETDASGTRRRIILPLPEGVHTEHTPEQEGEETDWGKPQGKEAW